MIPIKVEVQLIPVKEIQIEMNPNKEVQMQIIQTKMETQLIQMRVVIPIEMVLLKMVFKKITMPMITMEMDQITLHVTIRAT